MTSFYPAFSGRKTTTPMAERGLPVTGYLTGALRSGRRGGGFKSVARIRLVISTNKQGIIEFPLT